MKVAAIQMCSSPKVEENLKTVATLIKQAASNGVKLAVLPEMFAIISEDDKENIVAKETLNSGIIQDFLSTIAKQYHIWIVAGTIPIACNEPEKARAACLVFNDHGLIVARYDKIHLFDVRISESEIYEESATTQPGDKIVVIDTPIGRLGIAICYDIRFPELFRCLMKQGAEVIVIPAAFTVPTGEAHWELLLRTRAIDSLSYMIGACQGGTHASGRKTFGHSLICDPWGRIIASKNDMLPGIIYANIELEQVKKVRATLPLLKHQRLKISSQLLDEKI